MSGFFGPLQEDLIKYRDKIAAHPVVFDSAGRTLLDLTASILDDLAHISDTEAFDALCDYNISTTGENFKKAVTDLAVDRKSLEYLIVFFLRIGKEIEVKTGSIENEHLKKLQTLVTSKKFRFFTNFSDAQIEFALEIMPEKVRRYEYYK